MDFKRLGDIATYINGYAFKPSDRKAAGLPIIRIQDLTGNAYDVGYYDGEYPSQIEINDGDVLISWSASLGVYVWDRGKALLNQHIFKVVFDRLPVDKSYFVYAVRNSIANMQLKAHGATMKHIIKKDFENILIPYPTLTEQGRIAAALDTAERILSARRRQLALLDKMVKARFVEMFGDPVDAHITRVPLEEYVDSIRYGTSQPPEFSADGEYMFIRATNIKNGRIIDKDMLYISAEGAKKIEKCKLSGGELIIVRSGANTGDTCIITERYKGQYAGYDIIISLKTDSINPIFLNELINIPEYMRTVVKPLTARSAQPHLNAQQVQSLPVIVSEIERQNEFAAFCKKIDKSKFVVQQALDKAQLLFDSLMQQYFG